MTRVRFGIYLGETGPKLGRGKIELLKAIDDHGSISGAARSMRMSYRHAWLLLKELNASFDEPVICSTTGGRAGGGAALTEWGAELIARFEAMEMLATTSLDAHLEALDARLKSAKGKRRHSKAQRASRSSAPARTRRATSAKPGR